MKKPQQPQKDNITKKKVEKVEEEDKLELIIDAEDHYQENLKIFYIHPSRIGLLKHLNDNIFDKILIKNTSVDDLSSLHFNFMLRKLKIDSVLEVIVHQPLSVMQNYDAKQIEANAKLGGFDSIDITDYEFDDEKKKLKYNTLLITGKKPLRNSSLIEIEVQKIKK